MYLRGAMTSNTRHRAVAGAQLLVATLLLIGIWAALPARYLPVDGLGTLLGSVYVVSAIGLLLGKTWARMLARIVSWAALVLGALAFSLLAMVAAHLSGLYGAVGDGGALLMGTVAALLLPYLVGFPLLQLAWLRE